MSENERLDHWVSILTQADLPALKQTARDLNALRADEKKLTTSAVAAVIARDPIMTVKLLRYLQKHKRRTQTTEVVQVEQALLMLGIEPMFNKVPPEPLVESMFKSHIAALPHMLRVVHRSKRAADYAKEWAVELHDMRYEDVRVAAMLHDIAELLMWCFAPAEMLEIHNIQLKDKTLRSRIVQEAVLGFSFAELQMELVQQWGLPELLLLLMNESYANQPRVRNVLLAVNLARHSANGWDDAALQDDYKDIAELLRITPEQVMIMLEVEAGIACDINATHS